MSAPLLWRPEINSVDTNYVEGLDETLSFLREPKKVFFDISWEGDAISYYRSKRIVLPVVCPKCHQKKNLIAVRVITKVKEKFRYYITPVCKDCWSKKSNGMDTNAFFVPRFFLCPNFISEKIEHQKT